MIKKGKRLAWAVLLALVALAPIALGVEVAPVVDSAWVKANGCNMEVVVLDLRDPATYAKGHIPCAIQTDYAKDGWRVDRNGVVEVIPPTPDLEKLIGGLGIGNASHVVLVAPGSSAADMGGATRVFWTFTVLGHDKVSILNGGFAAYVKDKTNPLDTQVHKLPPVTFQAKVRNEMLIGKAEVIAAAKNGVKLVDSRPSDQYMGVNKSGQVKRYGTIPGAINLPGLWLTVDGGGMFRPKNELDTLFKESDAPVSGKNITFCNTGHWASLGWFVSYVLMSNKDTLMYDGSMTEYAADEALPIDRKVKL